DILTRGERWRISVEAFLASFEPIKKQFANLHPWERFFGSPDIWASAHANLEYLERLARTQSFLALGKIDLGPLDIAVCAVSESPFTELLHKMMEKGPATGEDAEDAKARKHYAWKCGNAIWDMVSCFRALQSPLLTLPRLLVIGAAGAGKSHSLAHTA